MFKRKIPNFIFTVFWGIFTAVVVCEISLQLIVRYDLMGKNDNITRLIKESVPYTEFPLFRKSDNHLLGYELIPGTEAKHIRINADGFRGPDHELAPSAGMTRIAVLGDSETFGMLLAEDDTLSGALEKELNRLSTRNKYEVLNFGVTGYNTLQEEQQLQNKVLKYGPDVVVLYYVFNDPLVSERAFLLSSAPLARFSYLSLLLAKIFYQKRIINNEFFMTEEGYSTTAQFYLALHRSALFEQSRSAIVRMSNLLAEKNIRFMLVIAPEIFQVSSFADYPYHEIHSKLNDLGSARIEVVDPLKQLAGLGETPRELMVTPHDRHKNAIANRAVAEAVALRIISLQGRLF